MSADIDAIGRALYGPRWKAPLARALGINPRTVQRWAKGDGAPSAGVREELAQLFRDRAAARVLKGRE